MATSGSVDSGGYQGRVVRFSWSTASTSGNNRTINYSFTAVGGSSSMYYHHDEVFKINDTTVYSGPEDHEVWTGTVIKSGTLTINQSQTTSLKVQMTGGVYYYNNNMNTTKTWSLDSLITAPTISSLTVSSKTLNTITCKFACTKADAWYYKLSTASSYTTGSTTGVTSGTFTISNLTPNTTYTINFRARNWTNSAHTTYEQSTKDVSGTTYAKATLTSVPNVNIGSPQTIKWTNPSGASISLKLAKTDNTQIINYGTVTGTSKTVTPTANTIYALTPNSNTYTARYILTTTQNSQTYTDSKDFTFTVTDSNPIFSNFTYEDRNETTYALTGNREILIKGYSLTNVFVSTANKAIAQNSATINTYKSVQGNSTDTQPYLEDSLVTLTLGTVDSNVITTYATDSRGNSTSVQKTLDSTYYKDYSSPIILSGIAERSNNGVGEQVTLSFRGTYWNESFGNITNSIVSAKVNYKITSASTYDPLTESSIVITTSDSSYSFSGLINGDLGANGFDVANSYNIKITITDELESKDYLLILPSGTPAIAIDSNNRVAIKKKYNSSQGGALQVGGDLIIDGELYFGNTSWLDRAFPVGCIYMSVNSTNPETLFGGTWTAWGTGRVPVGIDIYQTEFNTSEKTGGTKTHTLTVDEMPRHSHDLPELTDDSSSSRTYEKNTSRAVRTTAQSTKAWWGHTGYVGADQPHNNLQPYITCYMWKRIA
jgi:hypothetical protein